MTRVIEYSVRFLWLLMFTWFTACSGEPRAPTESIGRTSSALTEQKRVNFVLPAGVDFAQVALGANGTLQLDDRVQVLTPNNGFALSTNAGTAGAAISTIGLDTKVGSIVSTAAVSLKDRARVNGSVTSGRSVGQGQDVVITGSTTQNAVLTPVQDLSWNVSFTVGTSDITASSGQSKSVTPGSYRNVTAFSNGTITLNGAGSYYFDKLDIEPNGRFTLNAGQGTILIYVRSTLILRGIMSGASAEKVALAYLGTGPMAVESSFNGTFIAPNASIRFGTGSGTHSGAVLAKNLELDPSVRFTFKPYSRWDQITFNLVPTFSCVDRRTLDAGVSATLGYYNPNTVPVSVPVGSGNRFTTGAENRGQPTSFLPGRSSLDFAVDFGTAQTLTWSLQGTSLPVSRTAPTCSRTASFDSMADTTVSAATPRENFGSSTRLDLGFDSHALVKFDRAAIKQAMGTARTVQKATLEFTRAEGAKRPVSAYMMARTIWTETGATWNCAEDQLSAPDQEACMAGTPWRMKRNAAEEEAELMPWRPRTPERAVAGTWNGDTLSLDVTRDATNLLGKDGTRRGMSWIVMLDPLDGIALSLGSKESALKPKLNLEFTTFPDLGSGGLGSVSFSLDTTLAPNPATAETFPDGVVRNFGGMVGPTGNMTRFVEQEIVVRVATHAEVVAFATRWGGQILGETSPPAGAPEVGINALVRIDSSRANLAGLAGRVRGIDNRPGGAHRLSSQSALATLAAAAQEFVNGMNVGLNFGITPTAPSIEAWMARDIHEGAPDPSYGVTPVPNDNPFLWPGFATCNPALSDPNNPDSPKFCTSEFPDGSPMGQNFAVADAWRALAIAGRLNSGSVNVGIADNGWAPNEDYPPSFINNAYNPSSPLQIQAPYHGDLCVRAGFGVPGNSFGAAGPGGPVANLELLSLRLDSQWSGDDAFRTLRNNGSQLVSASFSGDYNAVGSIFMTDVTRYSDAVMFASAGNRGSNIDAEDCLIADTTGCWEEEDWWPCESDGVICVGGLAYNSEQKHPSSNWGADGQVDYAGLWTPHLQTGADGLIPPAGASTFYVLGGGGTSSATPYIAGIASLIAAARGSVDVAQIQSCLVAGSDRITFGSNGEAIGATRVPDALASVKCVLTGFPDGNLPPRIDIELPLDGATVGRGELTSVRADAFDFESGALRIGWYSDKDGLLSESGTGTNGLVSFRTLGAHVVTARATALLTLPSLPPTTLVQEVTATVNVNVVESPPTATVVNPVADGQSLLPGVIPFAATGNAVGVPNPAHFTWRSVYDADGTLDFDGVVGSSIQQAVTRIGSHTATVTRTDPVSGLTAVATRQYVVQESTDDMVEIIAPLPGVDGWVSVGWDVPTVLRVNTNIDNANIYWQIYANNSWQFLSGEGLDVPWTPNENLDFSCRLPETVLYVTVNSIGHFADAYLPIRMHAGTRNDDCLH